MTAHTLDLDTLHLDRGSHDAPAEGLCLLEAAAGVNFGAWAVAPPTVDQLQDSAIALLGEMIRPERAA